MTWDDLSFWNTGEWQVVQERLDDMDKSKKTYNPDRELLFAALDEVPFEDVKVMVMGQDPYPNHNNCTGVAFSIPKTSKSYPATLANLFQEYSTDLGYSYPMSGDLTNWCAEGVLLWNATPSCAAGKPGSHDWVEWDLLTKEIIENLSKKGIVFVFLGGRAHAYAKFVDTTVNRVICLSHPSPLGFKKSRVPFFGSRMFSTINAKLVELKRPSINWRL